MPRAEAELIFQETLKWLWLCSLPEREENRGPVTHAPMQVVDEMWHSFILCTRDYQRFCDENLGGYIHHQPIVDIPARKLRKV
jgi:hypothetical protein